MTPAYMVCYYSAVLGDCVVLKNGIAQDGKLIRAKALPIPYADFARRVMHSKAWRLFYVGPGSFHIHEETMTKNFLDYLYTQLMIDLAVLDAIYEAAEAGEPCEYRTEILEWFEENIAR